MNKNTIRPMLSLLCCAGFALLAGCSSQKAPAAADVAATREAVATAAQAGAGDLAPMELNNAASKLAAAQRAYADKDYKLARDLAAQAHADATLARTKTTSAKATEAANQVQENIRVLRQELDRANPPQ
jgi:predicted lipid-binding transport protein (Tim44 family)